MHNIRAIVPIGTAFLLLAILPFPCLSRVAADTPAVHPQDTVAGQHLFERHCAVCHGVDGKGGRGPGLNRPQLEHAPDDAALKSVIADGIPPSMPAAWFLTEDDLANVAAYVRSLGKIAAEALPGDPARGAVIFAKGGCANCHIFAGAGMGFGPDLTRIGVQRSPSHIKAAIRKPSANLPEGFLLVEATTASGETIAGIRVNEDTFSIQIKDATGHFHSLRKLDLKALNQLRGQTPMPSYEKTFSDSDLDDLIAYLAARGKS